MATNSNHPWLQINTTVPMSYIIGILLFVGVTSSFISDMYVPSLPNIMLAFTASRSLVQWTITAYLLGLSFPQLIYGPVSDKIGRRPVVIFGLSLALFGSVLCLFANSISILILGRLIQGIGVSAALVLSRSVFRDLFHGEHLARLGSYLALAFAVGPAIAPVLGGYLEVWVGWRGSFGFILFYIALALLLIYYVLPETNQQLNPKAFHPKQMLVNYKEIASNFNFIGNTVVTTAAISGIMVFYTMSPFIMQTVLGMSPAKYGLTTLALTVIAIVGRSLNAILLKQVEYKRLIILGLILMLISACSMLFIGFIGVLTSLAVVIPMMGFVLGTSLVLPNAFAAALTPFSRMAGTAGALYGALQTFGSFIITAIAACFHVRNQTMLALILVATTVLALSVYYYGERRNSELLPGLEEITS